jgi:hypothetical protein
MGAFLVRMIKPLLSQILITLGFSVITYAGADMLVGQLQSYLRSHLYSAPADLLGLLGLAGVDKALSIVFSAFAVKFAMRSFSKIGKKS